MKCLLLTPKSPIRKSDPVFLAKIPIIPNQYLFNKEGYNLGLLQGNEGDPLLLISDNDTFLERYRDFYEDRFEVSMKDDSYVVPSDYKVVYGKVHFDNEADETPEEEEIKE